MKLLLDEETSTLDATVRRAQGHQGVLRLDHFRERHGDPRPEVSTVSAPAFPDWLLVSERR